MELVIGPAARRIQTVKIQKGYANQVVFTFDVDETAVAQHVIDYFNLDRDDLRAVEGVTSLADRRQRLSDMEPRSDGLHRILDAVISDFQGFSAQQTVAHMRITRLPKFAYFSEYLRMPGQVAVNGLRARARTNSLDEGG